MFTIKYLVIFFIIILPDELQSRPQVDWFESINTLFTAHKIHTALFIHSNNTDDSDIKDGLFAKIMESIPSVSFEMDHEGIVPKDLDIGVLSKLSTSLLFIHYAKYSGNPVQIYRVMHSINKLADFSVNCYLLIVLETSSNSSEEIEDILQHAWNKTILNMAIVEIRLAANFNTSTTVIAEISKFSDEANRGLHKNIASRVIIHQFNPFIKKFYHLEFSSGKELFPNYAKNMHGHGLKVVIVDQPPFASVTWKEDGEVGKMSGPNILLMQTITEKLNATPVILPKPKNMRFWLSNFTVEDLINESLNWDLTAHLCVRFTEHILEESVRSQNIITHELGVLMPRGYAINNKIINNILESSALTLVMMLAIWLAAILLKFDRKFWKLSTIFRWIFSISVHHQPSRNFERIFFFVVVMLGFIYANNIYASLTNLGVDPLVENDYETLEAIDDTGLTPMIRNPLFRRTFKNATGVELNLKRRSIRVMEITDCTQIAILHRNVCCVLFKSEAEYHKQWSRTKNGENQLKFAAPIFWSHHAAFLFRQSLPGRKNINKVIKRCSEAGLLSKWYTHMTRGFGGIAEDVAHVTDDLHTLRGQLIVVAALGHSLAALVLIGELLTHRFRNSFKKKCRRTKKSH
ncbi:uncharacterized protein LOC114841086 [Diachasma alloeum]|uniref:Ionotropic receptor 129 n=1 Tax=Diachasma alloeum TaxID=454923 RepID=A0A4E0S4F2_9HYME|nr:uncharacterized protein LOC114841086 [Diachasma alloeum]THK32943.1 ionotropic receptor 129 [Diachasma alloeum]